MVLRLNDVLALDIVQQGQPEVVAAAENLDRTVRWVHIADIQEIAPLLKGGELLLSSGLNLSADRERNLHYVQELVRVGVAGVIVSLGWSLSELPHAMVAEAERLHLPLVTLSSPIPFVEVTERVHSEIVNRQYLLLLKAEQLGRAFSELVLRGAGVNRLVEELGSILHKPVVLEDAAHQVVKYWDAGPGDEDVLELWESHSRTGHRAAETTAVKVEEGDPGCAWLDIPLREDPWGRVHVLLSNGSIDEVDKLALDRAVTAIALALLSNRDAAQLANNAKGDLIAEIRRGTLSSPDQIMRRARALGHDLTGRRIHTMIVDATDFEGYVMRRNLTEKGIQRAKQDMLNVIRKATIEARCNAISAIDGGQVLTILGLPDDKEPDMILGELSNALAEQLSGMMNGLTATVGVSRECGLEGLPRAFEEAREAVIYGNSTTAPRPLYRFEELGLHRLILRLLELSELPQFVESELGPLLEHDAKSSLQLLPTLNEYLQHGGNKSSTAKAVHLERRSLYHRLDKISRLLDADLEDAETRTRLFVALKSLDVVRRSPGRSFTETR